jgi:hypothetical protein
MRQVYCSYNLPVVGLSAASGNLSSGMSDYPLPPLATVSRLPFLLMGNGELEGFMSGLGSLTIATAAGV